MVTALQVKNEAYPRVLVFSHNCFSKMGSNWRTLANFFVNWPKESLAQFYISSEIVDSGICSQYFNVTDIEALKALYKGETGRSISVLDHLDEEKLVTETIYKRCRYRTPLNYLVRNMVWDSNRWRGRSFDKWMDDLSPEVVVLQLGDYAFMLRIALRVAVSRNIPLVVYNSEDYYFKSRRSYSPLYYLYRWDYNNQVRKVLSYASCSIYISEWLIE